MIQYSFAYIQVLLNDWIPTFEKICVASFPILVKQISAFRNCPQPSRSAVIPNVRTARTNAVFFPSAQMKNVRHKPCEMLLNRLRFQLTRIAPNYIVPNPRQHNVPPQRYPREEVERCRRDRRRAPQSPSPISMTAPARICSWRTESVHKQDIGRTSDTIPAPSRCINKRDPRVPFCLQKSIDIW